MVTLLLYVTRVAGSEPWCSHVEPATVCVKLGLPSSAVLYPSKASSSVMLTVCSTCTGTESADWMPGRRMVPKALSPASASEALNASNKGW